MKQSSADFFDLLPDEVMMTILKNVDVRFRPDASETCTRFERLCSDLSLKTNTINEKDLAYLSPKKLGFVLHPDLKQLKISFTKQCWLLREHGLKIKKSLSTRLERLTLKNAILCDATGDSILDLPEADEIEMISCKFKQQTNFESFNVGWCSFFPLEAMAKGDTTLKEIKIRDNPGSILPAYLEIYGFLCKLGDERVVVTVIDPQGFLMTADDKASSVFDELMPFPMFRDLANPRGELEGRHIFFLARKEDHFEMIVRLF